LQEALEEKGFKVTRWTESNVPTPDELRAFCSKDSVRELWVISDRTRRLNEEHVSVIK
jgi:hypothetical protein